MDFLLLILSPPDYGDNKRPMPVVSLDITTLPFWLSLQTF